MAAGFVDVCWDKSISNASDGDTLSDEESQILLFFIRVLMKFVKSLLRSNKIFITQIDSGIGIFHPLRYLHSLPEPELDCTIYYEHEAYKLKITDVKS